MCLEFRITVITLTLLSIFSPVWPPALRKSFNSYVTKVSFARKKYTGHHFKAKVKFGRLALIPCLDHSSEIL